MKKTDDRTVARVILLNLLVLPGWGSIRGGRLIQGIGQITLVITGSIIMLVWLFKELSEYYGLMFGNVKAQSLGWIGALGVFLIAISWIWALITSLLFYRSSILRGSTSLENFAAPPVQKLDVARVVLALTSVPDWKQQGDTIVRTFQFKDFPAAIQFVDAAAVLAEQAWHHPDIDIRWNKVTLTLSTHDAGGLTEKDFDLARKFDRLSPG